MEEEMKQSKEIAEITTKLLQDWLNYIPTRTPDGNYTEYEQKGIQSYGFFYSRLPDLINKIIKIKDKEREEWKQKINGMILDEGTEFSLGYDQAIVEVTNLLNK